MIFAAVFLTVMALFFGVTAYRMSPAVELKRRLRHMQKKGESLPEEFAGELLRKTTPAEQFLFKLPLLKMVQKLVEHSGLQIKPDRFILLIAILFSLVFIAVYALKGNPAAAFLTATMIALIPFVYLAYLKKQRQTRFAEQLPDALIMIARSLRAGHSLSAAIELIGQEMPEPTGGLFKIAYEQQKLGMRIAESLGTLPEKIESIDLHFFVTIIRINSETGGNLAEILEKLGSTITSRLQVRRQVQVFTAEGRISGYVLVLLPVVVFAIFYFRNPGYMEVFFTQQICQLFLAAAVAGQVIGFIIMRKIIDIRI
jgi:tight adherence protein B